MVVVTIVIIIDIIKEIKLYPIILPGKSIAKFIMNIVANIINKINLIILQYPLIVALKVLSRRL